MSAPRIYHLRIDRFRGIKNLSWHPASGISVILGSGDVGKTTILEAFGFLVRSQEPVTKRLLSGEKLQSIVIACLVPRRTTRLKHAALNEPTAAIGSPL
jgi:predicted ATP-dependent endonuclease of OLD family